MTSPIVPTKPVSALLMGAAGGALIGGRPRHPFVGVLSTLAGLALVGAAASKPVGQALRRAATRRRSARLRFSYVVPHPVSTVFRFMSDFENVPKFVDAVREVRDYGDGRSHWVVANVSGGTLEWDAVTTKFLTNRVIAWQSTPQSAGCISCTVRFSPERGRATCVRIAIEYSVATERIKDAVAALASRRRSPELEADIRRLGEQLDALAPVPVPVD